MQDRRQAAAAGAGVNDNLPPRMSAAELHQMSGRCMTTDGTETAADELMAEDARRSRLTEHERMAEATARRRLQETR
jgi:hypothetical protein